MNQISIPKKGKSTIIMIVVPIGSRNENNEQKGISHFIEHLGFKGTKTRKLKEIITELDRYGGRNNAFTDFEITTYWTKIINKYKDKVKKILIDMVTNSIFPQAEIKKERNVIFQEIKMYDDDSSYKVYNYFYENLYLKNSGLHLPIIGTKETVTKINREELIKFHKNNYKNPLLIEIGDVKERSNINYIKPHKIEIPNSSLINFYTKKGITQSNIIIGNYIKLKNENRLEQYFALKLLSGVYNSMSGRLFSVIREKYGLVYDINFYWDMLSCGGIEWHVKLGLDKKNINEAYDLIIRELIKPIKKEELLYATNKKIGQLGLNLDNNYNIAIGVVYSIVRNIDYKEIVFNYESQFKKVMKKINNYKDEMNFNKNIMVGIVPENNEIS